MFDDEEQARAALRRAFDEPAPPPTTTVGQVIRRGGRRLMAQRAGAVAGVVLTVAAVTVGAVWVQSTGADPARVPVADSSSPAESPSTTPLLPGWTELPDRNPTEDHGCGPTAEVDLGPGDLPPARTVSTVVKDSLKQVADVSSRVTTAKWPPNVATSVGFVSVELPDGTVELTGDTFAGEPVDAADTHAHIHGNCVAPVRRVAPDGTVFQLYSPRGNSPADVAQNLRIYKPDGRMYFVMTFATGDGMVGSVPGGEERTPARGVDKKIPPEADGATTQTVDVNPEQPPAEAVAALPLDDAQLAELGTLLADEL